MWRPHAFTLGDKDVIDDGLACIEPQQLPPVERRASNNCRVAFRSNMALFLIGTGL